MWEVDTRGKHPRFTLAADQRGRGCSQHLDLGKFLSLWTGQQGVIWSWSHGASPEVNIKGNTPPTSNRPREAAEEGLAPCFHLEPLGPLLRQVRAHPSLSRDHQDCLRPGILLSGTEQINCISWEFPCVHQSPFSADVGEKLHCCPCLFELSLVQRGAPGGPSEDALAEGERRAGLPPLPRPPCSPGTG